MPKIRQEVAQSVAAELIPLEEQVDAALVRCAKMKIAAIEGRRRGRLPLDAGQKALELLSEAEGKLLAARAAIHESHLELRQVMLDMGVRVQAYGDFGDTPTGYDAPEMPALSVVNAAAA